MQSLRIEHLESPWQVGSVVLASHGGGWSSVEELQRANYARTWHPPKALPEWMESPERAVPIERGVLLEKLHPASGWLPFCRLELVSL